MRKRRNLCEEKIAYVKMINICKTLKSRYWSHVSGATTEGTHANNFCQSLPKGRGEAKTEKQKKLLQSFLRNRQTEQDVGDNLTGCVPKLLPEFSTQNSLLDINILKAGK